MPMPLSCKTQAITWTCVTPCGKFVHDVLRKVFRFFLRERRELQRTERPEAAKITSIEQLTALEGKNKLEAEKYLKEIVAQLGEAGVNAKAEAIYGQAAEVLSNFITKNDVDLVVIATHGRSGISRRVWGSVAERLLRVEIVKDVPASMNSLSQA